MKKTALKWSLLWFMCSLMVLSHAMATPIKLRVGHDLPAHTSPGMGIDFWAKLVNEKTEGRIVVEVFPAATLCEQKSAIDALEAGIADALMISFSTHRPLFPVSNVGGLPGLGFPDTVEGHMAHANTLSNFIEKYPAMAKEFKNYKIIFDIINSNNILLSKNKEVRAPVDLKGLKIGCVGLSQELARLIGAAPVMCVPPDAYQQLQSGVVDLVTIHFLGIGDFRLYEIGKVALDKISWGQTEIPLIMSLSSWNKIPEKDQQIIMEAALEGQKRAFTTAAQNSEKGRKAILTANGKIITPSEEDFGLWEQQFSKIWDKWVSGNEKSGVTNASDILGEWKKAAYASWGR